MIRLVDDVLRQQFGRSAGLASADVTLADPAVGTGTFILGVLRRIATDVEADQGAGAVPQAIESAIGRLIAFEIQLGPFAVAQLRVHAELIELIGKPPRTAPRMFVTDTLGSPYAAVESLGSWYGKISESRRQANEIKLQEPITVVIGNPPYKEKAKGRGGWIEEGTYAGGKDPLLNKWIPPADWRVGAHAKHLRNLYVYFWRWATWKIFDHDPKNDAGIVCFITVAGFLNGPGFQRMRDYLRRTTDHIWVIDCSPEGHQPDVPTRIFQAVQQPVCIVLAARSKQKAADAPAAVKYTVLPAGKREEKFAALDQLTLESTDWQDCSTDWRAPFLPAATGKWATYPALDELFAYNGSGVQPKRVWVIAPDAESLKLRWKKLVQAPTDKKEELFHATLRGGKPADRHIRSIIGIALPGYELPANPIIDEKGPCPTPVRYAFRSFNRQWIIPDPRVITQPNADLWRSYSNRQVYLTALVRTSPTSGPAITFSAAIPDLDHYNGRGGRVFPLWRDAEATTPNLSPKLLGFLATQYRTAVTPEDLVAYLAGVAANPAYTARFQTDLAQPGLRIPLTEQLALFTQAVEVGRRVIWLHTFGERFADPKAAARRGCRVCRKNGRRPCPKTARSRTMPSRCPMQSSMMQPGTAC
jgi:predicted helicase